jgi:hypothetical protein
MGRHITGIIRSYRKFSMFLSKGYRFALIGYRLPACRLSNAFPSNGCAPHEAATPYPRAICTR